MIPHSGLSMSQQDVKWKELSVSDSQASSDNSDVVRGDCCVRIARKRNDAFETERIEIRGHCSGPSIIAQQPR